MPGNPPSTAAPRPQAPAPWNPLDQAPPKHHSAANYQAVPAPASLAPLGDPHAPTPSVPAAFAPQPFPPAPTPPAPAVEAPAPSTAPAVDEAPAHPVSPPAVHPPVPAPAPSPAPPPRSAPPGTIASLLNPAPAPKKEQAFPSAGNGEAAAAPAVKSMSEEIAASIAASRAAKPAPGKTKMAAITASGQIAGGVNAPEARSADAGAGDEPKKRRGLRRNKAKTKTKTKTKKSTPSVAAAPIVRAAPGRVTAAPRKPTPLSQVRPRPDAETKKGAKGAFFLTTLLLIGAGVGGQYAVNEGIITPPWAEPAVAVDDCVLGAQTLGSLAAGQEIDVERVGCDQPGAQLVIALVDSEDQCPLDVDGVVSAGEDLFCVASADEGADTAEAEQ